MSRAMRWLARLGAALGLGPGGESPALRPAWAERHGDWLLAVDGHVVARLSGGRVPDQFWIEFDVAPVTDRDDLRAAMATDAFWDEAPLTLRSVVTGRTVDLRAADGPIVALEPGGRFARDGVVSLRGL